MAEAKYKTRQRDEILRFFADNADGCFTARDVTKSVSAGEATVFRTIASLAAEGKLKRYTAPEGHGSSSYYQYNTCGDEASHIHMRCEDCGRIIHADCDFIDELVSHFRLDHGFFVDSQRTVIYGKCAECGASVGKGGNACE